MVISYQCNQEKSGFYTPGIQSMSGGYIVFVVLSVILSIRPSIQVLTFYVKVLHEVFCSFLFF